MKLNKRPWNPDIERLVKCLKGKSSIVSFKQLEE
jgi:hypothetical protein